VDPGKIITIHNGVDVGQVRSRYSTAEAKERLGVPGDCWLIGTAGRLEPIKRLDIFLSAAKLVATQLPNTRFAIAGEGSEALRLRELARASRLQDRVVFLGHRDDIYDVLRALDIFVLCSDHEGLPMVLLEALCLGVPVVARGVGGISEAVQDGVNGILVTSANPVALAEACLRLLSDEGLRRRLSEAAEKSILEGFSVAGTAARVAGLYQSLAGAW
jgi:glycosyltransferase involved in cell wall biosynthesis